jgi:hypothetical protein
VLLPKWRHARWLWIDFLDPKDATYGAISELDGRNSSTITVDMETF